MQTNHKILLKAIAPTIKGTGWKKYNASIFSEINSYFVIAYFFKNKANQVALRLNCKPMSIDPLFWDIFSLSENKKKPLSFRGWGAICCPAITIHDDYFLLDPDSPTIAANTLFNYSKEKLSNYIEQHNAIPFSEQIKKDDKNKQLGIYGVSLVTTLIDEGKFDEAKDFAIKYESNELRCNHKYAGFNEMAIEWINNATGN